MNFSRGSPLFCKERSWKKGNRNFEYFINFGERGMCRIGSVWFLGKGRIILVLGVRTATKTVKGNQQLQD